MRERPILFSAPMVRALLAGTKTQTRRIVKAEAPPAAVDAGHFIAPSAEYHGLWVWLDSKELEWASAIGDEFRCPYGVPGDLLWVRETCAAIEKPDGQDGVLYTADGAFRPIGNTPEAALRWLKLHTYGGKARIESGASVPSIHMPRWASRISLRITDVRVERLQEISEADAWAEGCSDLNRSFTVRGIEPAIVEPTAAAAYAALWERINGPGSWDANPWVWAVSFERAA